MSDDLNTKSSRDPVVASNRVALLKHPACLLALGFGVGLIPKAPGTFGTLLALPLWIFAAEGSLIEYGFVLLIFFVVGVFACERCAQRMAVADPGAIVWDEVVGMLVALMALPDDGVWGVVIAFVLFRLFDIFKPGPVGWCDRHVHGGLGIMLDDVVAGLMAWCVIQLLSASGALAILESMG